MHARVRLRTYSPAEMPLKKRKQIGQKFATQNRGESVKKDKWFHFHAASRGAVSALCVRRRTSHDELPGWDATYLCDPATQPQTPILTCTKSASKVRLWGYREKVGLKGDWRFYFLLLVYLNGFGMQGPVA